MRRMDAWEDDGRMDGSSIVCIDRDLDSCSGPWPDVCPQLGRSFVVFINASLITVGIVGVASIVNLGWCIGRIE